MNQPLPQDVLALIWQEQQHFASAPEAFFQAWKYGVEIAGPQWFGDGTYDGLRLATSKWDLRPNTPMIHAALNVLSSGERMFLSAMTSFYDAHEGAAMLRCCGFEGLADFNGLGLEQRRVIAHLLLNYSGW